MPHARDIADEPDWEEITTLSQFRERIGRAVGVIVINDVATDQPIAHDRECPFIREEHFVMKVVDGRGQSGRYYWARNSRVAREQLSARHCRHPGDRLAAA
jgi:hypothetical protein